MIVSAPQDSYDIIIIGAGPAGLSSGMHLIGSGKSVLLVDKITPWEQPIACAEGVGRLGFAEALSIRKEWIRQEIWAAAYHAPDNTIINYADKNGGYIINRALMQHDLAEENAKNGHDCLFNARVTSVSKPDNGIRTVLFKNGTTVNARVVIDASGPNCRFGRDENIIGKPQDLEPAIFVWADNVKVKLDRIHIYTGSLYSPGGYAWVFPRDNNSANIGIVIGKKFVGKTNLSHLLDSFLKANFPSVDIKKRFAGSIPCHYKKEPLVVDGLIKAGDSASTVNPISRAGISEALLSGKLAAQCAIQMINSRRASDTNKSIRNYENQWAKLRGDRHTKLARVKNSLFAVPDRDYNAAAEVLSSVPQNDLTMSKIFRASLGRFPRLVWAMRHLM